MPEERESENPQNVDSMEELSTVEIGETSASRAKSSSKLLVAPMRAECTGAELGDEDRNLTMAEKDCVLTVSDDDVEDLSAFVTERLQCLSEGSVEKLIAEESMNMEEILCGNVSVEEDGGDKRQSECSNVTIGGDVGTDDKNFSPGVEINQILREELGSASITSTLKRAAWPIYTKRRGSVLSEQEEPLCNAIMFDVASGSGTVGGVGSSKGDATNTNECVPESFVTSSGFSALEGFDQRQADGRFAGTRVGDEGEGMVRIPPVDEMFGKEAAPKERTKYYPSQSAKSLLKECFELNPPTHLGPILPTTSFSAGQMIQFARAVGL